MFKNSIAGLVVFAYLLSVNAPLVYYTEHEINLDYIKKFLCIQKDEPENLCGGSCQLKLKMELADKQEKDKKTENTFAQFNFLSPHTKDYKPQNNIINSQHIEYFNYCSVKIVQSETSPETPPPQS